MSDKGEGASKALVGAAAFGSAYAVRKVMNMGWKKFTGKEPPNDPNDPAVGTAEALSWAIALGVVMAAARVLAIRLAAGHMRRSPDKAGKTDKAGKSAAS